MVRVGPLVVVVAVTALSPAVILVPLLLWTRWLRRRTCAPRFVVGIALALAALAAVVTLFGMAASVRALLGAGADASGEAYGKARALAEGIAEAMNCGALNVVLASVLALWLLFGTWRWHWQRLKSRDS